MNKEAYLQRLSILLSELSVTEREEALQYYRDYIEDAGVENEASVLQELGSPESLAADIKKGLGFSAGNTNNQNNTQQQFQSQTNQQIPPVKNKLTAGQITLIVIAAILLSPVWISILSTILSVIVGIFATIIGITFALAILGVSLIFAFFVLLFTGFANLFSSPIVAIFLLSIGCLLGSVGIFSLLLCILICTKFLPYAFRNIVLLCQKIFQGFKNKGVMV